MRHWAGILAAVGCWVMLHSFGEASVPPQRVAVLNMAAIQNSRSHIDFGVALADRLSLELSQQSDFSLIARPAVQRVLQEHGLNVEGYIDPAVARRLGTILDADVLVIGRWISNGHRVMMTVRLLWLESGLSQSLFEKANASAAEEELFERLTQRITGLINEHRPQRYIGPFEQERTYDALNEDLGEMPLPTVTLAINEIFLDSGSAEREAESHVHLLLRDLGFWVDDSWHKPEKQRTDIELAGYADVRVIEKTERWSTVLADVKLVVRDLYRMQVLAQSQAEVVLTDTTPEYAARYAVSDATDRCLREILPQAVERWHEFTLYP